jgi:CMP-N-acetylneuraminic acid synthetase
LEATPSIGEILVNTDDPEIADGAAANFPVKIIERSEQLRGDDVPMNDIILHDVTQTNHELFVQTHCTNPLLRPETIESAIETFQSSSATSLFSVTPFQARLWDQSYEPVNHERDQLLPTQELTPLYKENSNIYMFTQAAVESRENRISDNPEMFKMDAEEAVDIDEPIDFRMAEFLHEDRYGEYPSLAEVVER